MKLTHKQLDNITRMTMKTYLPNIIENYDEVEQSGIYKIQCLEAFEAAKSNGTVSAIECAILSSLIIGIQLGCVLGEQIALEKMS